MNIILKDNNDDLIITRGGVSIKVFESLAKLEYNYVDMGLPSGTLWADCNVGANSPEEVGLFFQWGDVEGFSKDSGRYCSGTRNGERDWSGDYARTHGSELGDSQNIPTDPYFDAARKYMGSPWRMPTTAEFQELFNEQYTTNAWVTNYKGSGMNGRLVTSKANGNTLFFPAAGYFDEGFYDFGSYGNYWSSSFNGEEDAYILYFYSGDVYPDNSSYRCCGYSVRAVQDPYNGHDYVEIGGLKWATMNVGANSVTNYGKYFQWGDTQGYTADQVGSGSGKKYFGWADYKYGNGTSSPGATGMTKYNGIDGKTVLEASDDAAQANWGGAWRMPTEADFQALSAATTNAWVTDYQGSGINGILFTDKTDSSKVLFFPAAGGCGSGNVHYVGSRGLYWSSSLYTSDVTYGRFLYFGSGYCRMDIGSRYNGVAVRGVVG